MKLKERWADDWCRNYAVMLPGMLDLTEAKKCFIAGFEFARKRLADNLEYEDFQFFIDTLGEDDEKKDEAKK